MIFLIAPVAIIIYVNLYNHKKKKHKEEREWLKTTFENELLKSQMEVREQTMQTIAGNLHDNIGQLLSLTIVTLSTINPNDPLLVAKKVESATQLAKRATNELRQMSRLIHGQELITLGLSEAIAFELDYLRAAMLHEITFDSNYASKKGHSDKEIILFRMFQEVLNNVIRHAEATAINVTIKQEEQCLILIIKDNGKGFVEEEVLKKKKGMGLFNIQKRAALISGDIGINTLPGAGTEIKISIPY
ncbi:MAG: sensor histidine kinase [Mucilaginibacter sp.]